MPGAGLPRPPTGPTVLWTALGSRTSPRCGRVVTELQPNQRAWLRTSEPVTVHESTAIVAVPNDFTRGQVEGRLRGQLEDALSESFGREIRIAVTVNPALDDHAQRHIQTSMNPKSTSLFVDKSPSVAAPGGGSRADRTTSGEGGRSSPARPGDPAQPEVHLRDLRHRLLQPVSPRRRGRGLRGAGKADNPLLVYGDSGLGKTHLLHAIGHYVRSLYTGAQVRYGRARSSPTSSSTRSATTGRTGSNAATATSTSS